MKVNNVTKSMDRELARIKTFVLDILAPLTSIIECDNQGGSLSHKKVLIAFKTAVQLIGKYQTNISNIPSVQGESHLKFQQRTTTPCPRG